MINKNFKYIKIFVLIIMCLTIAGLINNKAVAQTDGSISISLIENGKETQTLLSEITGSIKYNYNYDEEIKAKNTGSAKVDRKLDTDYIDLNLNNSSSWLESYSEHTNEQTVLYYRYAIEPGTETEALSDVISFNQEINNAVQKNDNEDKIELIYLYEGKSFVLEVNFEAIEAENAQAAAAEKGWRSDIMFNGDELAIM